ncbi:MAG: methyltransferase domain-containing protein [Bacteroidetes bacterium]|nr:methyltransferase domain-containing protein [Bacteroidota bacterium]
MKLYKNLIDASAKILKEIFENNRYADKAIEYAFKQNKQWGSRDRKFVAEAVYDCVRNFRLYTELAESKNNYWRLIAVWLILKEIDITHLQEFKSISPEKIKQQFTTLSAKNYLKYSFPDWLWQYGIDQLGEKQFTNQAQAMHNTASVILRANTLKTSSETLRKLLLSEDIETESIEGLKDALKLLKRKNIFKTTAFKNGLFEVQDCGSQQISLFSNPNEKQIIIDACAGAGGKSLHIAALTNNKGKIISLDVHEKKLEQLRLRANRAGAFNIETKLIEPSTLKLLHKKADLLLLDVPCSGSGVLKRNPDTKWKLNQKTLNETIELQSTILHTYSTMLKKEGTLIYSTCSIFPAENQEQIAKFVKTNKEFSVIEEKTILPSLNYDGFYMCKLKQNN